jgi:hypothetical protein
MRFYIGGRVGPVWLGTSLRPEEAAAVAGGLALGFVGVIAFFVGLLTVVFTIASIVAALMGHPEGLIVLPFWPGLGILWLVARVRDFKAARKAQAEAEASARESWARLAQWEPKYYAEQERVHQEWKNRQQERSLNQRRKWQQEEAVMSGNRLGKLSTQEIRDRLLISGLSAEYVASLRAELKSRPAEEASS